MRASVMCGPRRPDVHRPAPRAKSEKSHSRLPASSNQPLDNQRGRAHLTTIANSPSPSTTMSLAASRAVLRHSTFAVRRAGVRNASSTSEAAGAAKDKAGETASKASQGLSRVTSSAGATLSKVGSATAGTLGKVGGRTGRLIGSVQG